MRRDPARYRKQSEYNRRFHDWPQANLSGHADWKVTSLFYSALHGVNHWFAVRTGLVPESHFTRNQRVEREPPQALYDYRDHYQMSLQARYSDGYRTKDSERRSALKRLEGTEKEIPLS